MLSEERPADDQGAVGKVKPKGEDHKNAFPLVKNPFSSITVLLFLFIYFFWGGEWGDGDWQGCNFPHGGGGIGGSYLMRVL